MSSAQPTVTEKLKLHLIDIIVLVERLAASGVTSRGYNDRPMEHY